APTAGIYAHRIGLVPRGRSPFCSSVQARERPSGQQRPRQRSGTGSWRGPSITKLLSGTCSSIASLIRWFHQSLCRRNGTRSDSKERINHSKSRPPHYATTWSKEYEPHRSWTHFRYRQAKNALNSEFHCLSIRIERK